MADYEVSKLMWMGIAIALAASIFVIAQPDIKGVTSDSLANVQKVVDQIKLPGNSDTPSTDPGDYAEVSNYANNGTFAMDENGNGVLWATDESKPIIVNDWMTNWMEGENTIAGKTVSNPKLKTLTIVSPIKLTGNASMLFALDANLETIKGFDKIDVSEVTNFSMMFSGANNLKSIDVSTWDTSKGTNFSNMFSVGITDDPAVFKSKLTSLKLDNMNTSNGTAFIGIFTGLTQLDNFDGYKKLDYSKATATLSMFQGTPIKTLDFSNTKLPKSMSLGNFAAGMPNLETFILGHDDMTITSVGGLFVTSPNIKSVDLGNADVSKVPTYDAVSMFDENKVESLKMNYSDSIYNDLVQGGKLSQSILEAYHAQKP